MLASFVDFWNTNGIGLIVGFLGISATIYVAIRYAKNKKPCFYYATQRRIAKSESAPDEISISYKDKPVSQVSSTTVWFWNAGKDPIKSDDIRRPLQIILDGEELEILDVSVRTTSREDINLRWEKVNATTIELGFAFLDRRDGCMLEIQHTGSPTVTARMTGVILGVPSGVKVFSREKQGFKKIFPSSCPTETVVTPSSIRRRLLASLIVAIFVVILVPVFLFGFMLPVLHINSSNLTRSAVEMSLRQNLPDEAASQAVAALPKAEPAWGGKLMIYVTLGIFCIQYLWFLLSIWYRGHPVPLSLIATEDRRPSKSSGSPASLLPSATADDINASSSDAPPDNENANSRTSVANAK